MIEIALAMAGIPFYVLALWRLVLGLGVSAYLTLRLDIHYILDGRVLLCTSNMVDNALELDLSGWYSISIERPICFWRLLVPHLDSLGL